jgi:CheY-like chemotaxis protein
MTPTADDVACILIVDDQKLVRFVMERALEKLDVPCELVAVGDGREALAALDGKPFDLIITDLRMEDIGGLELTERIRARGVDAAVVWITAYGCDGFRDDIERLGVFRCVEKPLEVRQIRQLASDALEGR